MCEKCSRKTRRARSRRNKVSYTQHVTLNDLFPFIEFNVRKSTKNKDPRTGIERKDYSGKMELDGEMINVFFTTVPSIGISKLEGFYEGTMLFRIARPEDDGPEKILSKIQLSFEKYQARKEGSPKFYIPPVAQ